MLKKSLCVLSLFLVLLTSGCNAQNNTTQENTATPSTPTEDVTTAKGDIIKLILSSHDSFNTLNQNLVNRLTYLKGTTNKNESDVSAMNAELRESTASIISNIKDLQSIDMSTIPEPAATDVKNYIKALSNYVRLNSIYEIDLLNDKLPSQTSTDTLAKSITDVNNCFTTVGISITE